MYDSKEILQFNYHFLLHGKNSLHNDKQYEYFYNIQTLALKHNKNFTNNLPKRS